MYLLIVVLLALLVATPAQAQVQVDIGINLPAPPHLVVVREVAAVQYVPSYSSANLFYYNGQYWAYANDGWYQSVGYNGPWIVVVPQYVPQPLLRVPVTYYRAPPPAWREWHRNQAPQWGNNWGREWKHQAPPPAHVYVQPHAAQAAPPPPHVAVQHVTPAPAPAPAPPRPQTAPAHAPAQHPAGPPAHAQPAPAQPRSQPAPAHAPPQHEGQPEHGGGGGGGEHGQGGGK